MGEGGGERITGKQNNIQCCCAFDFTILSSLCTRYIISSYSDIAKEEIKLVSRPLTEMIQLHFVHTML